MNDLWKGFLQGVRETPRGFFAPLVAFGRAASWLVNQLLAITDSIVKPDTERNKHQ